MESAKFIDIHAHISDEEFDGTRAALMHSLNDFLVLNAGEDKNSNMRVFRDAQSFQELLPCIGFHPNKMSPSNLNENIDYLEDNIENAFAVSEIGLDYKGKDEAQVQMQQETFYKVLELAASKNKACIIHSRKAIDDVIQISKSFKLNMILHNFEGNITQLKTALDAGLYISISTGFMKFKKDGVIKAVDKDRMFVETDSPVLSPDENMNTPLNIVKLLSYISSITNSNVEELKDTIYQNFVRIFYD